MSYKKEHMHSTETSQKIQQLRWQASALRIRAGVARRAAQEVPWAQEAAQELESTAQDYLAQAEALKDQARLEDLSLWVMERIFTGKKGTKTYQYWMASWREGKKVHNEYLGPCRKVSAEKALTLARKKKKRSLGLNK
jgi:hypothetical protein